MKNADIVIKDFDIDNYRERALVWNLKSREAYIYERRELTYFDGVDLVQYDEDGRSYVKAEKGVFNEKSHIMTVEGNVVVISQNGRRLYTEYLKWNEKSGKLTTDRPVKIIFPEGDIIYGNNGMIGDQRLDRIEILDAEGVHMTEGE